MILLGTPPVLILPRSLNTFVKITEVNFLYLVILYLTNRLLFSKTFETSYGTKYIIFGGDIKGRTLEK